MPMDPNVSIVIPTYNVSESIIKTLDSVFAQKYDNFEVIVVDNGSHDNTLDILTNYPHKIHVHKCSERGAGPARNYGVSQSSGKFIAFLDADDSWQDSKLSKQLKLHENESDGRIITGSYATFLGKNSRIIGSSPRTGSDSDATYEIIKNGSMPAPLSTWLMRRELFDEVGGFDSEYIFSQDLEFLIRAVNNGVAIKILREELCNYSLSYASGTSKNYVEQYLTAKYLTDNSQDTRTLSLREFINQKSKFNSRYFTRSRAGKYFRLAIIDYSSNKIFMCTCRLVLSFVLDPNRFIKKIVTQSNLPSIWR